jgi:hypothetical protein
VAIKAAVRCAEKTLVPRAGGRFQCQDYINLRHRICPSFLRRPVASTAADEIFKTYINTTAMNFFDLHTEIRLKIYSELLVHSESIVFVADYGPPSPPLLRSKRDSLYPALLRVNKNVYSEASPPLYSNNRF